MTLLCYGTINPDLIYRVKEIPKLGDDFQAEAWELTYGGKAAQAAVALSAWEMEAKLMGLVAGRDPLGETLQNALVSRGVSPEWMEYRAGVQTRHCLVMVTPDGERTLLSTGYTGAHWQQVAPQDWEDVQGVLVDGFGGVAAEKVAMEASLRGLPVVWLDAPTPVLLTAGLVIWSAHERSAQKAAAAARDEVGIVLTAGTEGVLVWWEGSHWQHTPPPKRTVDATGAGDVFAAACLFGLVHGWGKPKIIGWATQASSLWAERGRNEPIPTLQEIEAGL